MNCAERTELLAVLKELCDRYPHWLFGQLVANLAGWADQDVWDVEDRQLVTAGKLHVEQLAPREPLAQH